jgi:hypothetical protein
MATHMTRRSLISGAAAALGPAAVGTPRARAAASQQNGPAGTTEVSKVTTFQVPFGPSGQMGGSRIGEARLAELAQETVKQTVVPPLSVIGIYAHGWLTDVHDLMVIYDVISLGFTAAEREIRRAVAGNAASGRAEALALPTNTLAVMTHWPARSVDDLGLPTGLTDLLTFALMERRANLVGRTGMAHLIRLIAERLVADRDLASTRLLLVGHSFGARVFAGALTALATDAPDVFTALQTRNQIDLVLLQPAMPADALEPNTVNGAHPFAQLANYQNLRILVTKSQWDMALVKHYPGQEALQPNDAVYAWAPAGSRNGVPALGAVGPTEATWRAFNGDLPRTDVSVRPGFQYTDILPHANQRLVVADLTPLHAAHRREDMERPANQLAPFGRPDRLTLGFAGYHTDIYADEIYQMNLGFAWSPGTGWSGEARQVS